MYTIGSILTPRSIILVPPCTALLTPWCFSMPVSPYLTNFLSQYCPSSLFSWFLAYPGALGTPSSPMASAPGTFLCFSTGDGDRCFSIAYSPCLCNLGSANAWCAVGHSVGSLKFGGVGTISPAWTGSGASWPGYSVAHHIMGTSTRLAPGIYSS